MGLVSFLSKPFARRVVKSIRHWSSKPHQTQQNVFKSLLKQAKNTAFAQDHQFDQIQTYEDFKARVPVRDYEGLRYYIDRMVSGEANILWPGKPLYWSKTSGTTSGVKYIPISKESIPYHINSARNALLCYIAETGNNNFLAGKLIFLSGSPAMSKNNGIHVGRLSGIVNHHVPAYLRRNQLPSFETNCIEDWEQKVDAIVDETIQENMTLISGIPPWVQMYFDRLEEQTGKKIKDVFPNFSVFVYGGVNFEPYRAKLEQSIGKSIDGIETYPASEGFIAFQDTRTEPGLLLLLDNGMFYEFIPVSEFHNDTPTRIALDQVELDVNYVIILNTNAGLWGYNIGDTVKFVSLDPYRIAVTGRVKHFISAFGEHVIGEEVEYALLSVAKEENIEIIEFTVAPQVTPAEGLPHHEWFIEFAQPPEDLAAFAQKVDQALQEKNIYYRDLLEGSILQTLKISPLQPAAFIRFMKDEGKLGGQNKVPRLSNDRTIADKLQPYLA